MRNSSYSIVYIVRPLKKVSIYIYDVEKADNKQSMHKLQIYKHTWQFFSEGMKGQGVVIAYKIQTWICRDGISTLCCGDRN